MKNKMCKVCGAPLKLGKFAYNQEVCWDCFVCRALDIAKDSKDEEIVVYLLNCLMEAQGIKGETAINKASGLGDLIRDIVRKELLEYKGGVKCLK